MADKSIDDVFDKIAKRQLEQERAAYKLQAAFNTLSEVSIKKLMDEVKNTSVGLGVLNSEQASLIKNSEDLADALLVAEKTAEKVKKAQDDLSKTLKTANTQDAKLANEEYKRTLKNLNLKEDEAEALVKNVEALKQSTEGHIENSKKFDKLKKSVESVTASARDWFSSNINATAAMNRLVKGVSQGYDEFVKLSRVGLQGTLIEVNKQALQLRMTFDEFSEVVSKNRDIVNIFGGGSGGIQKLGDSIDMLSRNTIDAASDLSYMGKDGRLATARFFTTIKMMGTSVKDGKAFTGTMRNLQKQFKEFNAIYGDSYEDYAKLIEGQFESSGVQQRLLGVNKSQISLVQQEIFERTKNLKLMGMSNDQIDVFNKKLEDLYDPNKNNQEQKVSEAINLKNLYGYLVKMNPNSELASAENRKKMDERYRLQILGGNKEQIMDWSSKNSSFTEAFQVAIAKETKKSADIVDRGGNGLYKNQLLNSLITGSGSTLDTIKYQGDIAAKASLEGRNYSNDLERYEVVKNAAIKEADAHDALSESLKQMRDIIEPLNNALQNTGVILATGLATALLTIIGKSGFTTLAALLKDAVIPATSAAAESTSLVHKGFTALTRLFVGVVLPALSLKGAWDGYNTSTSDYYERLGLDPKTEGDSVVKDLGVRATGVMQDVGSSIVKGLTFGHYDPSENFKDKQRKAKEIKEIPGVPNIPSTNLNSNVITPQQPSGSLGTIKGFNEQQTKNYLKNVEATESGGQLGIENRFGFMGRYQFGAEALVDQGLIHGDKLKAARAKYGSDREWYAKGHKEFLADNSNWKIAGGKSTFLSSESLQDKAMIGLTSDNISRGIDKGAIHANSDTATIAGFAKAAHLKGWKGATDLFLRGIDSKDANGTSASLYAAQGAAAINGTSISNSTKMLTEQMRNQKAGHGNKTINGAPDVKEGSFTQLANGSTAPSNDIVELELKNQTALLAQIANNTNSKMTPNVQYKKPPADVANNIPS